jgi:hypothetical protein
VYLCMLRRWAHNSTYTDVANPHNRIDVPLDAGTPVVGESVVDVHLGYMTEARRDGRNGWTTVVHNFIGSVYGL